MKILDLHAIYYNNAAWKKKHDGKNHGTMGTMVKKSWLIIYGWRTSIPTNDKDTIDLKGKIKGDLRKLNHSANVDEEAMQ